MIKQLFSEYPQKMRQMLVANIMAIIGFFLLYQPFSPRPYSNMLYFFLMLAGGVYLANETGYVAIKQTKKALYVTTSGIIIMLAIYAFMRISYQFVVTNPALGARIDSGQWPFFVKPWLEINRVLSVASIVMIVFALEFFHRAYIQEFFTKHMSYRKAIFFASLLSGIRGLGGGYMGGPIDFLLCLVWGWVFYHGGFFASIVVHLSWDICFVYFAP